MSLCIEEVKVTRTNKGWKNFKTKRFFRTIANKRWKFRRPAKIEFIINAQNDVVIKPITKKAIDVFGQLSQYKKDKPLSIEEMNEAITMQCKKEFL